MSVKQDRLSMPTVPEKNEPSGLSSGALREAFATRKAVDDVGLVDDKAQMERESLAQGIESGTLNLDAITGSAKLALKQVEQDADKKKKKEQDATLRLMMLVQEYLQQARERTSAYKDLANILRDEAQAMRDDAQKSFDLYEEMHDFNGTLQAKGAAGEPLSDDEREKALKQIRDARKRQGIKADVDENISDIDLIALHQNTMIDIRDFGHNTVEQAAEKDAAATQVDRIVKELEAVEARGLTDEQKQAAYEKIFEEAGNKENLRHALERCDSNEMKERFKEFESKTLSLHISNGADLELDSNLVKSDLDFNF